MSNAKPIKIYGKTPCSECKKTEMVLKALHLDMDLVEKIDVFAEEGTVDYVKETYGFSQLPIVVAEGFEPFCGFNPNKLGEIINSYK